ncbi:hypothetical protein FH972_024346 [Carpinus fangiana]|uniref:RNA polymerase II subunit A C-terminal domain phosphatase SSU72 n=1 Tax=Carpinus fangiana TaxID=176857 RepID=A0A5N6KXT2_9ROSI|nr:hypothetical protein FH972_024346 [Carpinus fangiana]
MSTDPRLARARQAAASATPPPPPPPATGVPDTTTQPIALDGANDAKDADVSPPESFKLRFCTVCASNNNRSMEGHLRLSAANYPVISFGTGSLVRLPGPSISQPNVYNFNTSSYETMYNELDSKDPRLYRANGILNMLERNKGIKWGPERFQDWKVGAPRIPKHESDQGSRGSEAGTVDVIITCEERCWDAVVDDLLNRGSPLNRPVHVFNVDIKDSHEEALVGGKAIVDLADNLNNAANAERVAHGSEGWNATSGLGRQSFDSRVPDILGEWQERWPQFPALWTLAWL